MRIVQIIFLSLCCGQAARLPADIWIRLNPRASVNRPAEIAQPNAAAPVKLRSVQELEGKISSLLHRWHPSARPGNDGSPGNTLEDLLGIAENNLRLPDFGEVDIKTTQYEAEHGLLTLFHKEPEPDASVPKLLKCLGWRHRSAGVIYGDDEMSFRSTTWGDRFTDRGMKIEVIDDKIYFLFDPAKVNGECEDRTSSFPTYGDWLTDVNQRTPHYSTMFPVHYDLSSVNACFKDKLNHTLLVLYKTKTVDGQEFYRYEEAFLMKEFKPEMIKQLIEDGDLAIDFDARTNHNHGTKFRVIRSRARDLFTDFREIE